MEKDIQNKQEAVNKLQQLVKEVNIAMLTTLSDNNEMCSRPMGTAQVDDNGDIWFFTKEYSDKAGEISQHKKVSVTYSDSGKNTYLAVTGHATVVDNKAKMKELWNPILKAWFPDGLNDPKIALLHISTEDALYWDSHSNKMVTMFRIAKAAITENKSSNIGEHGELNV